MSMVCEEKGIGGCATSFTLDLRLEIATFDIEGFGPCGLATNCADVEADDRFWCKRNFVDALNDERFAEAKPEEGSGLEVVVVRETGREADKTDELAGMESRHYWTVFMRRFIKSWRT